MSVLLLLLLLLAAYGGTRTASSENCMVPIQSNHVKRAKDEGCTRNQ